jgi:hypothetical protein
VSSSSGQQDRGEEPGHARHCSTAEVTTRRVRTSAGGDRHTGSAGTDAATDMWKQMAGGVQLREDEADVRGQCRE